MDALSPRLKYLLNVYLDHTATAAEKDELMELMEDPVHAEIIEAMIGEELQLLHDPGWTPEKRISNERSAHILSTILPPQQVEQKRVGYRWGWWAAAAVIIAVVGIGGSRLLSENASKELAASPAPRQQDAAPGGNKAILTLAGGTRITLDSMHMGKLAQQGKVNIMKLDSGRLAYSSPEITPGEVLYNTLTTPRGGQYRLTLPDGTQVWLDAESSIRYPTAFVGKERKVTITGQAYFEVAANEKMPFMVDAEGTTTTVLGTHFNINAYTNEKTLSTTLLEGSVKVSYGGGAKVLHPGEQAVLDHATSLLSVRKTDTYQAVAWKNGQFDFDQMDLPAMMRQISRWYDVTVAFQSNNDSAKFGGGISRQLNLSDVLRLLDKSGIHTRLEDKKLIVLP